MNSIDLYCDGGVMGRNPSLRGGTWAWCQVQAGLRIRTGSGTVTPAEVGMPTISNNLTELLAAVEGMESLPDGWIGTIWTDSKVTMLRISLTVKQAKLKNVPKALAARMYQQKSRLGAYGVSLLGGHPSRAELAVGRKLNGQPCSPHNVWCDTQCGREAFDARSAAAARLREEIESAVVAVQRSTIRSL